MKRVNKFFYVSTVVCAMLSSCSAWFQGKVDLDASAYLTTLSSLVTPTVSGVTLKAPANIYVSQGQSPDTIAVSWSNISQAAAFKLERAVSTTKDENGRFVVPDESEFQQIPDRPYIFGTTFEDVILKDADYSCPEYDYGYFYRVCAVNEWLGYADSAFTGNNQKKAGYLLPPPKNVTASCGLSETNVRVTWDKANNVNSYIIYRSTSSDGSGATKIGTSWGVQNYFDNAIGASEQGIEYYYQVVAVTENGNSVLSNIALGFAKAAGAPPSVTGVTVDAGNAVKASKKDEGIKIKWTAINDTNVTYTVYRKSSVDSTLIKLKDKIKNTEASYTDKKGLKDDVFYYYQVQAISGADTKNPLKGSLSNTGIDAGTAAAEGFAIAPPKTVTVTQKNGNDVIEFSAAIGSVNYSEKPVTGVTANYTYKIYGANGLNDVFSPIAGAVYTETGAAQTGMYRIEISGGDKKKFYKISATNGSKESDLSTAYAPPPLAAKNPKASKAAYIAGYTDTEDNLANNFGVHAVQVTWEANPDSPAEGGYYVYRSTKPDSGYVKISEDPVHGLSYIDKNLTAKPSTFYYYSVLSLNSLGQGANYTHKEEDENGNPLIVYGYGALSAKQYMKEYNKTIESSQKKLSLMHKPNNLDKLGQETIYAENGGTLSYDSHTKGLAGEVIMLYTNYADWFVNNDKRRPYFLVFGNTNTDANMSANGHMWGTTTQIGPHYTGSLSTTTPGLYGGTVVYDELEISGGKASGGGYTITREGFPRTMRVIWTDGLF